MTTRLAAARLALRLGLVPLVAFWTAGAAVAAAENERSEEAVPPRLVYVPPDVGAPPTRTLAATRGLGEQAPLQVLAPRQTGLTVEAQPVLYWYLATPSEARLEVAVADEEAVEPLVEADLGAVKEPGVHALDLARFGVELSPGVEYRWSVAQVVDPAQRSADRVASATIERTAPDESLRASFEGATPLQRLAALAERGYWYDVIGLLSQEIGEQPDNAELRALRAGLLEQEGLDEVAREDREAAKAH